MIGILGSGFGLYGYLPALAEISVHDILFLNKARDIFFNRAELNEFKDRVHWAESIPQFIKQSEVIVLAIQPERQQNFINEHFNQLINKKLILEKPLAKNAEDALSLLNKLNDYKIKYRVAYTLIYTDWLQNLKLLSDSNSLPDELLIEWLFLAHHYKMGINNWKKDLSQGGGIINFYGIHFIAVCVYLGYQNLVSSEALFFSKNDLYDWECVVQNNSGKKIRIKLNSFSKISRFRINIKPETIKNKYDYCLVDQPNLFNSVDQGNTCFVDSRINLLQKLYSSFDDDPLDLFYYSFYTNTNNLWKVIINNTILCESS
jgi:hypothetical protein